MRKLFEDRTTGARAPEDIVLTETMRTILGHASCRAYTDQPVPEALLDALISAAQSAPSSCNLQCWSVVSVREPKLKGALSNLSGHQAHIESAPLFLCFLADLARIEQVALNAGQKAESLDYLEMFLVGVIDAALAAQNLVTAAESCGLGTCYIGGLRNDIAAVAETLDLPPRVAPVFGITLGYPDQLRAGQVKPRLPQSLAHFRDRYTLPDVSEGVRAYEERMASFNVTQGRHVEGWGLKSGKRVSTRESLEGRDNLQSELRALRLAVK